MSKVIRNRSIQTGTALRLTAGLLITAITETEDGTATTTALSSGQSGSVSTTTASSDEADGTVFSICPTDEMTLTLSVDETDILALSVGQEAQVTIDSLGEETFTGTLTELSTVGSSADGVTTYSATVTMEKVNGMLEGMSASAVIAIEGKENALLAVKIDNPGGYTIGDELTVTDGDGHSETGKVSRVEKDSLTVTVELEDFTCDEKVTVTDQKGKKLGKGPLFVYSPLRITGYSGTIQSVHRSAGASVSKGSRLFTLSDGERTAEYQTLLRKRSKLVEQYNKLVTISKTGRLTAAQAGLISGLDQTLLVSTEEEKQTVQTEKTQKADETVQTVSRDIVTDNMVPTARRMSLRSGGARTMGLRSSNVSLRAMNRPQNTVFLSADLEGQEEPEQQDTPKETPENTKSDNTAPENGGQSEQPSGTDEHGSDEGGNSGSEGSGDPSQEGQSGGQSGEQSPKPSDSTVNRSVSVRWQDKTGAAFTKGLPASLTVTLNADGKAVDTVQLNSANGWSKRWQELSVGSSYTVSCDVPSGFTGSAELSGDSISC